jgi:hypothetical protein
MSVRRTSVIASLLLGATAAHMGRAQEAEATLPAGRNGFQILSLSGYGVYYSSSLPGGGYQPGAGQLLSDVGGGGSARLGWMNFTERSSFSFIYTPSFTGRVRYSEWNALNHAASLTAITHPARRWSVGVSVSGDYSSLDQFLFSPTAYSAAVATPGQFSDLASAVLAGRFSTPQLASIFNTAPTAQSPLRNLLYGQRMFTMGGQMSVSYSHSPRLSLTFTGSGTRNQHVHDDQVITTGQGYLIADTTSGSGSAAFNYSVSPLTQLGGTVTMTRMASTIYDGYTTTSVLTLGRTFAHRWLFQGRGGVGVNKPLRYSIPGPLSTTAHPVAGGSIGFRTFAHTFLASFDRTVSDSYGAGASTSATAGGTWRWNRPGNSWWLEAGGGWDQLQGNVLYGMSGWRTSAGVGRTIGRHTSLLTQYSYLNYSGQSSGVLYNTGQSAVRLSIVWAPDPANR